MNTIIVYYQDGYAGDGDEGLQVFESTEEAVEWIEERLTADHEREISNYRVFRGQELTIKVIEKVVGITIT